MKIIPDKEKKKSKKNHSSLLKNSYKNSFKVGKYNERKVNFAGLPFSKLYSSYSNAKRYIIAAILGIVMAFFVQFLVKNTGLYNSGLSAVVQGLSRFVYSIVCKFGVMSETSAEVLYNFMFWVLYFILNVPLFIFAYLKIGKNFSKITFIFLFFNVAVGFLISSVIPGINEIFIFGKSIPDAQVTQGIDNPLYKYHVYVIPYYYNDQKNIIFDVNHDSVKSFFLLLYAIAFGIITSYCYALLYIIGSCSAGLDFISIYYSTKKNKNISSTLFIINTLSMLVGSLFGSYFSAGIIYSECWNWQFLISANFVSSLFNTFLFSFLLSRLFPLNQSVKVEIYSSKIEDIRIHLYEDQYIHAGTIIQAQGAYSLKKTSILTTICMMPELPKLIAHVRDIDENSLITVYKVSDIDGKIQVFQQGSIE